MLSSHPFEVSYVARVERVLEMRLGALVVGRVTAVPIRDFTFLLWFTEKNGLLFFFILQSLLLIW
jgi:hypothetical protein